MFFGRWPISSARWTPSSLSPTPILESPRMLLLSSIWPRLGARDQTLTARRCRREFQGRLVSTSSLWVPAQQWQTRCSPVLLIWAARLLVRCKRLPCSFKSASKAPTPVDQARILRLSKITRRGEPPRQSSKMMVLPRPRHPRPSVHPRCHIWTASKWRPSLQRRGCRNAWRTKDRTRGVRCWRCGRRRALSVHKLNYRNPLHMVSWRLASSIWHALVQGPVDFLDSSRWGVPGFTFFHHLFLSTLQTHTHAWDFTWLHPAKHCIWAGESIHSGIGPFAYTPFSGSHGNHVSSQSAYGRRWVSVWKGEQSRWREEEKKD